MLCEREWCRNDNASGCEGVRARVTRGGKASGQLDWRLSFTVKLAAAVASHPSSPMTGTLWNQGGLDDQSPQHYQNMQPH
eukprot:9489443-Pyramimonas_sp.AAC.1